MKTEACDIEPGGLLRAQVCIVGAGAAGITLACGSGTCAVAVAAHLRGLTGRHVVIDADGGQLVVDWRDDGVWLTGPTVNAFSGHLSADFLAAVQ